MFIKFITQCAAEIFWDSTILSVVLHHLLFSSITCTDSRRDSPQCSRLTILGSRSRHRRNILSASWSCWYGFDFPVFDWVFWRVRSTNTTFYTSPLRSKVISFMIDEEPECYLWNSNFYSFVSTADVILAGALTSAEHGSSHGQTSFSGYLPPHVDSQHHSSPDIHTHHHNTPSTIFTPGGSWRYPYLSGSGLSTVTQGESHLECLFVNEVMDLDSESLS